MHDPVEGLTDIGHIIQHLKFLISSSSCVGINHVSRNFNMPAYMLAKYACDIEDFLVWIEEALPFVTPTILAYIKL